MPGPILILGGTAEARTLAATVVGSGRPVVSSLAGRVRNPALPLGEVRVGGFSSEGVDGVGGLEAYLVGRRVTAVVDATHPFAAVISANAAAACLRTGTPLLRLERPGWQAHLDADRWTWVGSVADAVDLGAWARRPFLTTGRQALGTFVGCGWADKDVLVRLVDPPELELPARWRVIRSRGPYAYADELALMREAGTDLLVTKDSGGSHTSAKLDAARTLDVRVLVVARPPTASGISTVATVEAAVAWLDALSGCDLPGTPDPSQGHSC